LAVRDWWGDLLVLGLASLAWSALTLTIIGGPPAGAALYAVARATSLHKHPDARLFAAAFQTYFVRSWLLGVIGLVIGMAIVLSLLFPKRHQHAGATPSGSL
jgi:uncharacterized membrane protein YesL